MYLPLFFEIDDCTPVSALAPAMYPWDLYLFNRMNRSFDCVSTAAGAASSLPPSKRPAFLNKSELEQSALQLRREEAEQHKSRQHHHVVPNPFNSVPATDYHRDRESERRNRDRDREWNRDRERE